MPRDRPRPALQAFFTDRLIAQRQVSGRTIAAYRDTFRLLLAFAQARTGTAPCDLHLDDLDADLIGAFLEHLRNGRHNGARTRNARLAAIHSLFRYAALRHPEHAALIQRVLAIPPARFDKTIVSYLTAGEAEALLAAPDRSRWVGRRDHALLAVAIQTGLRVCELTASPSPMCTWAPARTSGAPARAARNAARRSPPRWSGRSGTRLRRAWRPTGGSALPHQPRPALSRDLGSGCSVARHTKTAQTACPTLRGKTVSPHVLRHTAAMALLHAGVDITVIALWLGHEHTETAQIYINSRELHLTGGFAPFSAVFRDW